MQYIDYDYYSANGGTVDVAAFPLLEKKARYKLDYYTQNRIKVLQEIPESVKDCMIEIINAVSQTEGERVSSFSNDGVSVSFELSDEENTLYKLIVQMLPLELVYLGVD